LSDVDNNQTLEFMDSSRLNLKQKQETQSQLISDPEYDPKTQP